MTDLEENFDQVESEPREWTLDQSEIGVELNTNALRAKCLTLEAFAHFTPIVVRG